MSRKCSHRVHVKLDSRRFIVDYDAEGSVLRIKERKRLESPSIGWYDVVYWSPTSHRPGAGTTIPNRVMAAARGKIEGRNDKATP